MAQPTDLDELAARAKQCYEDDRKRQELTETLLARLTTTTEELEKVKLDLENESSTRRSQQLANKEIRLKLTARPYVLVIIDADGYHFLRTNEGESGGRIVADILAAAVRGQLERRGQDFEEADILVETYANTEGLGRALVVRNQVRSVEELRSFFCGFVCRQRLFTHVDVGRGKENADQRIREKIEFHHRFWQCKQVYLAGCHDEGYATFLGQFVSSRKITLLKNEVCHPKLEALGLPLVELSAGIFAPPEVLLSGPRQDVPKPAVRNANHQYPLALKSRLGPVLMDVKTGLRQDRPLSFEPKSLKRVEGLCPWLYLKGQCKGCDKGHLVERKLELDEFDALWYVSRRGVCYKHRKGKACDDVFCIYGHRARAE